MVHSGEIAPTALVRNAAKKSVIQTGRVLIHIDERIRTADADEIRVFMKNPPPRENFISVGFLLVKSGSRITVRRARPYPRLLGNRIRAMVRRAMIPPGIFRIAANRTS